MRTFPSILIAVLLSVVSVAAMGQRKPLSPMDFGWREATSDSARFWVLYNTHTQAVTNHTSVSYAGLDTLDIEIPSNAQSIPLGRENDFAGVVFRVKNTHKNLFLFHRTPSPVNLGNFDNQKQCQALSNRNFDSIPRLTHGLQLLHVVDSNAWVGERAGHPYGHYREDLILIRKGEAEDIPSAPYLDSNSRPHFRVVDNPDRDFSFSDITLLRDSGATHRTYLLDLSYQCEPILSNITVITPPSTLVDDCILRIQHCHRPIFDSIRIQGSYSRPDRSGYGILMNNCTSSLFTRLYARTPWGVFGTNNMNQVDFFQCDFDRFDIHCYGRNITFFQCNQQDSYNQFSSVYGFISYRECTLSNFTPVLIENSYNAYNHFSLEIDSCTWHLTPERNYLMDAGKRVRPRAIRSELQTYCLPDIQISNLTLTADRRVRGMHLFHFWGKPSPEPIHGIQQLTIEHLTCPKNLKIELTERQHKEVHFANHFEIKIEKEAAKR